MNDVLISDFYTSDSAHLSGSMNFGWRKKNLQKTRVQPLNRYLPDRANLAVTNNIVLALNNQVLSVLPGDEVVHEAMDKIISDDPQDQFTYPKEFLNSLTPTGMPSHK